MSTNSQKALAALAQRVGAMDIQEIGQAANLTADQVYGAVRTLVLRGYAERRGKGRAKATMEGLRFLEKGKEITRGAGGPRMAETEGTHLRSRIWRALRLAQKATVSELLELASRGTEGNAAMNAKDYLNALVKSGHVMRLSRRGPSDFPITMGPSRYCLALNTGPQAPQFNKRQKRVFDPNTGETFDVA